MGRALFFIALVYFSPARTILIAVISLSRRTRQQHGDGSTDRARHTRVSMLRWCQDCIVDEMVGGGGEGAVPASWLEESWLYSIKQLTT